MPRETPKLFPEGSRAKGGLAVGHKCLIIRNLYKNTWICACMRIVLGKARRSNSRDRSPRDVPYASFPDSTFAVPFPDDECQSSGQGASEASIKISDAELASALRCRQTVSVCTLEAGKARTLRLHCACARLPDRLLH